MSRVTEEKAIRILTTKRAQSSTDYQMAEVYTIAINAIKALEQDPYDFARWVASEIFDDMWEFNKDAFEELTCRKLEKLGIVRANGNEWELVEPEESDGE